MRKDNTRIQFLLCYGVITTVVVVIFSAFAQEEVPPDLQATIFMKILSYDRTITESNISEFKIAIVYDGATAAKREGIVSGFKTINGKVLQGKNISVVDIKFEGQSKFIEEVNSTSVNILYVIAGAESSTVNGVVAVAKQKKMPTLGGSEELVKQGIAVGLKVKDNKPSIVINLPASQSMGMQLSAQVLKLADVIQ